MLKLLKKLLLFMPVLAFMMLVSWRIDPSGLFWGSGFERMASEMLLDGEYIAGYERLDGRLLNETYAKNVKDAPEVLIDGSSRVMLIDSSFSEKTLYNAGNVAADVYDLYNAYYIFEKEGKEPEILFLGLDPWLFSDGREAIDKFGRSNRAMYAEFMGEELGYEGLEYEKPDRMKRYLALIDPSYFQASVKYYFRDRSADVAPVAVTPEEIESLDDVVKCPDGSIIYDVEFRTRPQASADHDAMTAATVDYIARLEGFDTLSQTCCERFIRFLDYLDAKGIKVIFYLPAYHPFLYDTMKAKEDTYHCVFELEDWLKALREERGIECYGSYSPYELGFTNEDFMDGLHLRKESIRQIIGTID